MSPAKRKGAARRATVALTRRQVEFILVRLMGWEPIDVTAFWRFASKLQTDGAR